jgi:BASS family bile acid:Na+ symporter
MWAAVRLLVQDDAYATGLLLVAFAAAGPLGLKLSQVSGADTAYAIGIVVVLEAANIVLIPLWSGLLDVTSSADVLGDMIRTVALLVLLPLGIGMTIRRLRPDHAAMLAEGALRLATIGLLVVVTVVVVRSVDTLLEAVSNGAALASVVVIALALAAGWLLGGPARPTRLTTSLVTGCRANGAALAVATSAFASVPGVAAGVVTAGLVSITLPTLMAYCRVAGLSGLA